MIKINLIYIYKLIIIINFKWYKFQKTFKAPEIPEAPEEFPSSDEEVDQDIYLPAKELFDEVNKWMTKGLAFFEFFETYKKLKGNSLIDAAKRMALLMAEMSRLVQEGGNKGEVSNFWDFNQQMCKSHENGIISMKHINWDLSYFMSRKFDCIFHWS